MRNTSPIIGQREYYVGHISFKYARKYVPIVNLPNYNLSNYCFVDKNKNVRRFLAANMESLADSIKGNIDRKNLEHFHQFLRGYRVIFTNNIYATKDYTYYNLWGMIQNKDIVVIIGDKDYSVVRMKKSDYVTKLDTMIDDGIMKGSYVETNDSTLKELSQFQDFLYKNFLNYELYKDMQSDSNQPACVVEQLKSTSLKL